MPFLDIHTLLFVMGAIILSLSLLIVYYNISRRTYPGFNECTLGFVVDGVGFFLIGLRGVLPDFITIVVANGLLYSGLIFYYYGFKSFASKR